MNYWFLCNKKQDMIPNKIYKASYFSDTIKILGYIKMDRGVFLGTKSIDPTEWIIINPKHIYSLNDIDKTMKVIYIMLWYMVIIRTIIL